MGHVTSLAELLDEGAGEDLAVHADDVDHSLHDLRRRVGELVAQLEQAGLGAGGSVAVMLPDGFELVAALFGVWRARGVYVPVNPRLGDADLDHLLDSVDPAVVLTTEAWAPRFDGRLVVALGPTPAVHPGRSGSRSHGPEVALVQFTSGTTGRPRPVLLHHDGVLSLLDNVVSTLRTRRGDAERPPMPNLVPVSLSLWAGIYQVLFARRVGAAVVLLGSFDTRRFADLVARFGIRSVVLPPAAMTMLADDDAVDGLAPLRYVRSITAPLSPLQARRFRDRFGISVLNCYGQTEIGGEIIGWSAADSRTYGDLKLGSVGRPHRGVEVRRSEPSGELEVLTPAISGGYADGQDLTDRLTGDGWFRTGDVGRIDDDGFVWIEGRVSDMINRGGLKVFPGEVEEVLRLSSAVADAAVVGVADERLGEVPWAFVVARGDAPTAEDLSAWCREHLAPFKVPVRFEVVESLPRNEVGKVVARELLHGR